MNKHKLIQSGYRELSVGILFTVLMLSLLHLTSNYGKTFKTEYIFFLYSVFVISIGYILQIGKVIRNETSDGVSIEAYFCSVIAALSMFVFSESKEVAFISVVEVTLGVLSIPVLLSYTKEQTINKGEVILGLLFALVMIHGVVQLLKTIRTKTYSAVSSTSYLIYGSLEVAILVIAESSLVKLAGALNLFMYIMIISISRYKNSKLPA